MATRLFGIKKEEDIFRYNFDINLPSVVNLDTIRKISSIVNFMKPVHTQFRITQPNQTVAISHWSLGQSDLGINTDLHA